MADKYNSNYPSAWSQAAISFYQETGKEPPKTSNGIWVEDVVRETRDLIDWVVAELYALANGELYTKKVIGDETFYKALRAKAILDDRDATRWGEEDLMSWLLFEKTPEKSPGGFYINDPERWTKEATSWSNEELIDLAQGYFGEPERSQLYILDEASERFEIPVGITFADFQIFIREGLYPVMTSNHVLINDRRRASKTADEWTEAELEAWVLGELESTTVGLLEQAIKQCGGEWYWGQNELKFYLTTGDIPEFVHDYSSYTDNQLRLLEESEHDNDASLELLVRYPRAEAVEEQPSAEEIPENQESSMTITNVIIEGNIVLKEDVDEEPVVVDEEVQIEEERRQEELPQSLPKPEPTKWSDLVREDTPLHTAMVTDTPTAVIADSERRRMLTASKWTAVELVGWARGHISSGLNTTSASLIAALRASCGAFVQNWTDGAVLAFVCVKALPEGFDEGILVQDIIRDKKHPSDWSEDELRAWAAGKIITTITDKDVLFSMRVRMEVPDRLTEEQAKIYVVTGELPVNQIPPILPNKPVTEQQLLAWLSGTLKVSGDVDADKLFILTRTLFSINVHWTDGNILAYYRTGTIPAVLEDGVYVEDRLRDTTRFEGWSWKELRHLLFQNVRAEFVIRDAVPRIRRLINVQFGISPAHWSDDEVIEYLRTASKPTTLDNGVFVNDPTRATKVAGEWRDAELKAWLKGDIEATESATDDSLWDELYARFKVPLFWYHNDAKTYVLDGTKVPALPSGLWLRDRNRDARKAKYWTRREIKAWSRNLIPPGINASEEELINQSRRLFGLSAFLDAESVKRRISDMTEESMTMTVKFVTEDLKSYEVGRVEAGDNAVKAAPYQTLLDRCITRVMRLDGEDFVQGWTELLLFFHKNSTGICSMKKAYVGVGQMTITPKGLRNFQNMTTVLIRTCNPVGREAAVRLIDWNAALREISNEKTRQNVLAYYSA